MCFITWVLAPFKNFVTDLFKNEGSSILFLDELPVVLECLNVGKSWNVLMKSSYFDRCECLLRPK